MDIVRSAAEGARLLADLVRGGPMSSHDGRVAPACASAILVLVEERLRFLDGVLADEVNREHFVAPHNQARMSLAREQGLVTDDIMIALDGDATARPTKE